MKNQILETQLNRMAKWRRIFMMWQCGNKPKGHLEADAVTHHRELSMMLRAEVSALSNLLIRKGVFTQDEWERQLGEEADYLALAYGELFPGTHASTDGITFSGPEGARTIAILLRQQPGPLRPEHEG